MAGEIEERKNSGVRIAQNPGKWDVQPDRWIRVLTWKETDFNLSAHLGVRILRIPTGRLGLSVEMGVGFIKLHV